MKRDEANKKTIEALNSECIKLRQEIQLLQKDDKNTIKDFKFTNCNDCIHKINNKFTETCFSCKRYYGCYFEKK